MSNDGAIYNIGGHRWQYLAGNDHRWFSTLGCARGSYDDVANTINVYNGYPPDFVQRLDDEVAPISVPQDPVAPVATSDLNQELEQETKGQSEVSLVSTPENKTGRKQAEQSVAPVSTTVGNENQTAIVSPTLNSSQDLASQAANTANVAPVVTTSNSLQTSSAQTTSLGAQGAVVEVSPVLNVQMGDTYEVVANSSSDVSKQPVSWETMLAGGAVALVGLLIWKRKSAKNKEMRR